MVKLSLEEEIGSLNRRTPMNIWNSTVHLYTEKQSEIVEVWVMKKKMAEEKIKDISKGQILESLQTVLKSLNFVKWPIFSELFIETESQ